MIRPPPVLTYTFQNTVITLKKISLGVHSNPGFRILHRIPLQCTIQDLDQRSPSSDQQPVPYPRDQRSKQWSLEGKKATIRLIGSVSRKRVDRRRPWWRWTSERPRNYLAWRIGETIAKGVRSFSRAGGEGSQPPEERLVSAYASLVCSRCSRCSWSDSASSLLRDGARGWQRYPGYACQSLMHLWFSVVAFRRRCTRTRPPLWRHGSPASLLHFSLHSAPFSLSLYHLDSILIYPPARTSGPLFYTRFLARGSSSTLPLFFTEDCFLRRPDVPEKISFCRHALLPRSALVIRRLPLRLLRAPFLIRHVI